MFLNVKTAEEVNQAGGGGSSLRSTGVAVIQMIEQSIFSLRQMFPFRELCVLLRIR